MRSLLPAVLLISLLPAVLSFSLGFPYGTKKVRGVNLGGWLIIESWMTPAIFKATNDSRIVDEYTFCKYQPKDVAKAALEKHWKTWITEKDFKEIAAAGLNHVRLPVGYWALDNKGDPYIQGQMPYLEKALCWAKKYHLKVIIDLHGAPGSQNGFDNSGRRGIVEWHSDPDNVKRTRNVLKKFASMYKDRTDVVTAIEVLNEPAGWTPGLLDVLKQFFYDSYDIIRYPYGSKKKSKLAVILPDGFQPVSSYWRDWMPPPKYEGVIMDTHIYQVFSDEQIRMTWDQHITAACDKKADMLNSTLWQIVGEFSPSPTECGGSPHISGIDVTAGSRWDGTAPNTTAIGSCIGLSGSATTFSQEFKEFMRKYWEAQISTYELAGGWIMWSWKGNAEDWSYQAGLKYGWIPKDPTERKHPHICQSGY